MSLPVSHVTDKYFAVPATACAAEQGSGQKNPAISPVRVARLFFSSLVPATDASPSFELTLPVAGRLPDVIGLGAQVASRLLSENSFAGKLVAVLVTCCSSLQMAGAVSDTIDIPDAETLSKIGHDPSFPLDGHYRQTGDITARYLKPLGSGDRPFTGRFDGNGKHIDHVSSCLFGHLSGDSTVTNLHLRDAVINSRGEEQNLGVIACTMTGNSRISQALVENSSVNVDSGANSAMKGRFDSNVAIGSARMTGNARIDHLNVVNGCIYTSGNIVTVGAGAGTMDDNAVLDQLRAMSLHISNHDKTSYAGIGAGRVMGNTVVNGTTGINCTLFTFSGTVHAATGVGTATGNAVIENTLSLSNMYLANAIGYSKGGAPLYSHSSYLAAGAGASAGRVQVLNTTAIDDSLHANALDVCGEASVGIGIGQAGGMSYAENTEAIRCNIEALENSFKDVSCQSVYPSWYVPEEGIAFDNVLHCSKSGKMVGGKATIDGVVQIDRCIAQLEGGISCKNRRDGPGKSHYFPNSPECNDICWSTVSNVSNNTTGIHFDRSCQYINLDKPYLDSVELTILGLTLLGASFFWGISLYQQYRQGRPEGEPVSAVDRLFRKCEGYLGIAPPPVQRRSPDSDR